MKKDYSKPESLSIRLYYKAVLCQMSGVGTEGTEDIDLDDLLLQ